MKIFGSMAIGQNLRPSKPASPSQGNVTRTIAADVQLHSLIIG
jgi:hypothetical protein